MMAQVPKWLADPLGPLSIPPAYFPKLLPWLYRFWRASAPYKYDSALATQAGLMKFAQEAWVGLMARSGTTDMLRWMVRWSFMRPRRSFRHRSQVGRRATVSDSRTSISASIGGAVEFAGLRRPPNFARPEATLAGTGRAGWKTMDGLSSFAARFSDGNRPHQRTSQRLLRFRTWSSRPHAIGCHRPGHPRPHTRPSTSWVRPLAILPAALQNTKMSASSKQLDRTMRNGPSTAHPSLHPTSSPLPYPNNATPCRSHP
jgi:hypothetical protein